MDRLDDIAVLNVQPIQFPLSLCKGESSLAMCQVPNSGTVVSGTWTQNRQARCGHAIARYWGRKVQHDEARAPDVFLGLKDTAGKWDEPGPFIHMCWPCPMSVWGRTVVQ